jgi:hypothetical protein
MDSYARNYFHSPILYGYNRAQYSYHTEVIMTSEERREVRYLRRRNKRRRNLDSRNAACENVFSFSNLYKAYRDCCLGVGWKSSVQLYKANALYNVLQTQEELLTGSYRSKGFVEFNIFERGKLRHIKSVHISERVVQRCLCDNALIPIISPSFIYDNGASLKDKGIDFTLDRLEKHLHRYYRKHGSKGYVLTFDFSKFFDNANHEVIFRELEKVKGSAFNYAKYFVDRFGKTGLGLGSQVSQILALALPNSLDHMIKELLKIKYYGRYMDDGYLIHESKDYLRQCLSTIQNKCLTLGIALNPKKTHICKLKEGVSFLKMRFMLTDSGRVIRKLSRESITRMRRKLKSFAKKLQSGAMTTEDVVLSYNSWRGHAQRCDSFRTLKNMDRLLKEIICTKSKKTENTYPTKMLFAM